MKQLYIFIFFIAVIMATDIKTILPSIYYEVQGQDTLISCLIKYSNEQTGRSSLDQFGAQIKSERRLNIHALVPIQNYGDLGNSAGIEYVTPDFLGEYELNESTNRVFTTAAHNLGYKGDDTFIGIIDSYIYWDNPDFLDDAGDTRIILFWDQTATTGGLAPPAWASYGRLFTNTMLDEGTDIPTIPSNFQRISHGSHVAGIAAGSGGDTGNGYSQGTFSGIAPESYIIAAYPRYSSQIYNGEQSISQSSVLDAIEWMAIEAAAIGEKIVVNLSSGWKIGPRNGSSIFEQQIDELMNIYDNLIIVKSAGNDGLFGYQENILSKRTSRKHASNHSDNSSNNNLEYRVFGFEVEGVNSNDEYIHWEIWTPPSERYAVSVKSPNDELPYTPTEYGADDIYNSSDGKVTIINNSFSPNPFPNTSDGLVTIVLEDGNSYIENGQWYVYLFYKDNSGTTSYIDTDGDGIYDDGDLSGVVGDNYCTGGNTVDCDDNCVNIYNPSQTDENTNGIGDDCESIGDFYIDFETNYLPGGWDVLEVDPKNWTGA